MFEINQDIRRPSSPEFDGDQRKNMRRRCDFQKIHRIKNALASIARVLNVVSPSEIYIRWNDVITPQVTVKFPTDLPKIEKKCEILQYVMAPWKEDVLGRARVMQTFDDGDVYVIFIDEGQYAVVPSTDLYEMPEDFRTHPWQATKVVLYGAIPQNKVSWTPEEVTTLRTVLAEYPAIWVVPVHSIVTDYDDSWAQRVKLHGLKPSLLKWITESSFTDFGTFGECVLTLFKCLMTRYEVFELAPERTMDGRFQLEFPFYVDCIRSEVPRKTCGPVDCTNSIPIEPSQRWFEINPFPQMRKYSLDSLVEKGHLLQCGNSYSLMGMAHNLFYDYQLPHRFFMFRMKFIRQNEFPRIKSFYESQKTLLNTLNSYYFSGNNLHHFDFAKVNNAIKDGIRVFAIYEKHQYTPIYIHAFERIEILSCTVESARTEAFIVRFLDSGGVRSVPVRKVFHIHPQHLDGLPLALLLTLPERFPVEGKLWTHDDKQIFRKKLGQNNTFVCDILNAANLDISKPIPVTCIRHANTSKVIDLEDVGKKPPIQKPIPYFDIDFDHNIERVRRYFFEAPPSENGEETETESIAAAAEYAEIKDFVDDEIKSYAGDDDAEESKSQCGDGDAAECQDHDENVNFLHGNFAF